MEAVTTTPYLCKLITGIYVKKGFQYLLGQGEGVCLNDAGLSPIQGK